MNMFRDSCVESIVMSKLFENTQIDWPVTQELLRVATQTFSAFGNLSVQRRGLVNHALAPPINFGDT